MDNKENFGLILGFFIIIGILMVVGFMIVVGSSVLNYTFDIITPEISNIGMVGSANMTEISGYSIDVVDTVIQSFTWLTGVAYMLAIIGLFGLVVSFKVTASKWFMGFFLALALLLIMGSIFMSNIYQDIYQEDDDLSSVLREHTLLSYLILHSPVIFTILIFISGIILFSGMQEEFV